MGAGLVSVLVREGLRPIAPPRSIALSRGVGNNVKMLFMQIVT